MYESNQKIKIQANRNLSPTLINKYIIIVY